MRCVFAGRAFTYDDWGRGPVVVLVHAFPGAGRIWPRECVFSCIDEAVALIRSARPGLYREWVGERYGLERQQQSVLRLLAGLE